uniref:Uncharacterized protein n=1 Tax=Corethron hystrix TaxID=216773 RepID=A0A7S1FV61_9STRA|mmetsp:Transcript_31879/g.73376  ORF Transcript_31879/g.73376 Transcript_31879/m.73376 type:complete len:248 (+) Transcript_31879:3-746(+)
MSPKELRPSRLLYEIHIGYPSQSRKKLLAIVSMSIMTLLFLTTQATPTNAFLGTIPAIIEEQFNLAAIAGFYESMPYTSAFITCGINSSIADYIAQFKAKTSEINFKRNNAFFLYGGLYLGIAQYFIYNKVFPVLFGAGNSTTAVIFKVMADMLIVAPFFCVPLGYLTKAIVFRQSLASGLAKYWKEVKNGLLLKCWSLWIPVQLLTFSVVPEHLRIVFVASVSFFWSIILSSLASGDLKKGKKSQI